MDLTDLFKKDAAIVDHEWMKSQGGLHTVDGEEPLLDVEGIKNPNNTKPELEVQWGGSTGPDFEFEDLSGVVERDEDGDGVADSVITFARDQMNRGLMGRDLNRAIRAKFDKQTLFVAREGLAEQLKWEGIVGCIAVDGRGYRDCKAALAATELSPYKRFIKYVVGCQCGTPYEMPRNPSDSLIGQVGEGTSGAVDSFLADEAPRKTETVAHCPSTMLPLRADELDPSVEQDGLMDVTNTLGLPEDLTKKLWKKKGVKAFQAAFLLCQRLREAKEDQKYAGMVDNSEYWIAPTDMPVDVAPEVKRKPLAVNPQANRGFDVEVCGAGPNMDGIVPVNGAADQLSVEFNKQFVTQEVEPSTFMEKEFEGTDEIDLEARKAPTRELDVTF